MFSDHPDTAKRAEHIKELAEAAGYKLNTTGSSSNIKPKTGNNNSATPTSNTSGSSKPKKVTKKDKQ